MKQTPTHTVVLAAALTGCADIACTLDATTCVVASPCEALTYTCDAGSSEVRILTDGTGIPGGVAALGAPGDVLLANDQIVAVIDAIDHPHYLAPTGGTLIDLVRTGQPEDGLRQVLQATGLLPDDTVRYTDLRILEDGPIKAVQVTGELDGRPGVTIATRYEVRPCEPGIRVRTELYHGGTDALPMILADGWYLGDRGHVPFTPSPGAGFVHPSFGLSTISDVLVDVPYLIAGAHPMPGASYGSISCNRELSDGFHSDIVSVMGAPTRVILPRDSEVYERFIIVGQGPSVAGAADVVLEARRQLHGEAWTTLSGTLTATDGAPFGWPARAQLVIAEGAEVDGPDKRTPWTHVVPDPDGSWTARVPTDRTYTIEVEAFGQLVTSAQVEVFADPVTAPDIPVPAVGQLTIETTSPDLLVFVQPSTPVERDALDGRFLGTFEQCAPLLGHPHGSSPACDLVLVRSPSATVLVPAGSYDLHAVHGPFSTLAQALDVEVVAGQTASVTLESTVVDALPTGWRAGDFHVHGSASFDSGFGDDELVRTFAAAAIDVVASTEHDVVSDLTGALTAAGLDGAIRVIQGTESTGHVLFPLYDDTTNPKVIGHWNLFPIAYDPLGPYRGAPWDELVEPGALFERAETVGWDAATGIAQLNHPWGGFQFGRDFGWAETIALDLTQDLPDAYDGSGASLFLRTPPGTTTSNAGYHVQEVMNGSANKVFQPYRAIWFYLLEQGLLRGGTANSDTHSLTENVLGFPRTLVRTGDDTDATFLAALRDGRMVGTNGPLLDVWIDDGSEHRPSLTPFTPGAGASLRIQVSAMGWVPVDEVRIIVNGEVVDTLTDLLPAGDALGTAMVSRLDATLPLADLLPSGEDAWIVVEAGVPLVANADLDCNGVPDTGDTNGDGTIDWQDVDGLEEDPGTDCFDDVGPLAEPLPPDRGEPGHAFSVVVPGGMPMSFSNPLVLDHDGNGWSR